MSKKRCTDADESLPVWPEKVIGRKYVRRLEKFLRKLRDEKAHGNRDLFLDDVFVVYLLAFHNPSIRSLRTIEDFSQTRQAQQHLSIRKVCKSTLSDFNKLADPQRLEPIMHALRHALMTRGAKHHAPMDRDLHELLERTIAVDGTFVHAVADVTWAIANSNNHGATRYRARLDAHLNVATWVPEIIVVPKPGQSEADTASEHLQAGRIYVYDRGYMRYALLRAHGRQESDEFLWQSQFVVRFKPAGSNSPELHDAVEQTLTEKDRAAGIISDRRGYFTSNHARREGVSKVALREIVLTYQENGETKTLRLITNLLDVPAHVIALLYKKRWSVELFFRWFKSFAHFGHLISHSPAGVQTHLYVTIIAVMLMYLHTGYRPSKYMFALLEQVAIGNATLDDILPILRERERRNELDRQSAARRRAKKKS